MSSIQKRLNKMEIFFDQEEFIVVDIGTGCIKAGFAGEDLPRVIIPTVVGERTIEVDPSQQMPGQLGVSETKTKTDYVFGNNAYKNKGTHEIFRPVQRGVITDMEHLEKILFHIFEKEFDLSTKEMNVLMTDSPMNSKENKMEICKMMFETFKVNKFTLINQATLSLFSTGTTTGLVAESGEGLSYAVPVFEGFALPHAVLTLNVAGQDVT